MKRGYNIEKYAVWGNTVQRLFVAVRRRGFFMQYSYNKLWKLLIAKGMTKTEMRMAADISANILAKMG